jgi:hypothetical protein
VGRWESVFGPNYVTVIPFKKEPNMTGFLIQLLGLNRKQLTDIERRNEAVDWRIMALVNVLSAPPFQRNQTICQDRDVFARNRNLYSKALSKFVRRLFIDDWPFGERLEVGLDIARRFHGVFEDSNNILVSRRKELSAGDLTPDWTKYDVPANIHHLDSKPIFAEQLSYLFMLLNWEINLERCSSKLAECESAVARNDFVAVRRYLEIARTLADDIPDNKGTHGRLAQITERLRRLGRVDEIIDA